MKNTYSLFHFSNEYIHVKEEIGYSNLRCKQKMTYAKLNTKHHLLKQSLVNIVWYMLTIDILIS